MGWLRLSCLKCLRLPKADGEVGVAGEILPEPDAWLQVLDDKLDEELIDAPTVTHREIASVPNSQSMGAAEGECSVGDGAVAFSAMQVKEVACCLMLRLI